ncbi:protein of unknown function [Microbacterium sp. Nx66]|nr:protein of unknown function [Microbacterium sp. Nx66]
MTGRVMLSAVVMGNLLRWKLRRHERVVNNSDGPRHVRLVFRAGARSPRRGALQSFRAGRYRAAAGRLECGKVHFGERGATFGLACWPVSAAGKGRYVVGIAVAIPAGVVASLLSFVLFIASPSCASSGVSVDGTNLPAVDGFDAEQLGNAAAIANAGAALGVSQQGQTIAIMTAIGESSLHVLDYGDQAGPTPAACSSSATAGAASLTEWTPRSRPRSSTSGSCRSPTGRRSSRPSPRTASRSTPTRPLRALLPGRSEDHGGLRRIGLVLPGQARRRRERPRMGEARRGPTHRRLRPPRDPLRPWRLLRRLPLRHRHRRRLRRPHLRRPRRHRRLRRAPRHLRALDPHRPRQRPLQRLRAHVR